MRSRAPLLASLVLTTTALATSLGCSGASGEDVASGASDLAKGGGPTHLPPILNLPPFPVAPPPPPPPPNPYVGDANDTDTIVADEKAFAGRYLWMTVDADVASFENGFTNGSPIWSTQQHTSALVQMYDLMAPINATTAAGYLERLRRIASAALDQRDDNRLIGGAHPMDAFRHRVMFGWGMNTEDRDNEWNTDIVTAGVYTYAMAAFARRVATDPSLQTPEYVADAIRFTSATLDSLDAYRGELHLVDSDRWAYFTVPVGYSSLQCNNGGDAIEHACQDYRSTAGQPISWNENFAMMKALAEAAIAADSPMYRASSDANASHLYTATHDVPLLIAKSFTFFDENLTPERLSDSDPTPVFTWNHQLPLPHVQDTAHGGFELGSLAVLLDDQPALNDLLARSGRTERVGLSTPLFVRFANTFLRRIWHYDYKNSLGLRNILDEKVDGTSNPGWTLDKNANEECAGWIPLAQFDSWVWTRCRDATYEDPAALREDNHAALLRYRQFAPQ